MNGLTHLESNGAFEAYSPFSLGKKIFRNRETEKDGMRLMDSLTISKKPKWSTHDLSALNPCAPSYKPNSLNSNMTSNLDPLAKVFTLNGIIEGT